MVRLGTDWEGWKERRGLLESCLAVFMLRQWFFTSVMLKKTPLKQHSCIETFCSSQIGVATQRPARVVKKTPHPPALAHVANKKPSNTLETRVISIPPWHIHSPPSSKNDGARIKPICALPAPSRGPSRQGFTVAAGDAVHIWPVLEGGTGAAPSLAEGGRRGEWPIRCFWGKQRMGDRKADLIHKESMVRTVGVR